MSGLSVGLAGLGYWGPNLLRNFHLIEGCEVRAIADHNPDRRADQVRLYPGMVGVEKAEELIADPSIDAIVFALPAEVQAPLAIKALEAGKHVMVEKPMAPSLEMATRMRDAARATDRVAMVDFTFVYSSPVRHLRWIVENDELGGAHYYQSTRINLGRFQPDVDVLWDLAVHDIAILGYVLQRHPVTVMAMGRGRLAERADTAHLTLVYEDGFHAFVQVSWMSPMKVRTTLLGCERGTVVYNDMDLDEKIRVYELQQDPEDMDHTVPNFRLGDVLIPNLPQDEPLRVVAESFVSSVVGGADPLTDWNFGLKVVEVLDAASRSLLEGRAIEVGDR